MGHGIRRRRCRVVAALAAVACFATAPAWADDVSGGISAEGAQRLEQQVHAWLASMLGPHVTLGARPLHVTAESDHYRIELPFATALSDATGTTIEANPISARLKPLDGGRWAINDFRWPSPLQASFVLPRHGGPPGTEKLTVTIARQEQHGVLDPSLTTPSFWDARINGYAYNITGMKNGGSRKASIDDSVVHLRWEPAPGGKLTVRETSDSHLFATSEVVPNVGLVSASVERMQAHLGAEDVVPDQVAALLRAMIVLAPTALSAEKQALAGGDSAPNGPPKLNDAERAAARSALMALAGLLGSFDEQGTAENLHVVASRFSERADKLTFDFGAGAPEGRSRIHLRLGLDGLDSPDIPSGVLRDYLPHHIAIASFMGGISSSDLYALLLRVFDSNGHDPKLERDLLALLAKQPLAVGLDDVQFDLGPAMVSGKGEVRLSGVNRYEGEAHFAATGLDELVKRVNAVPAFAKAMPVLYFLKGVGEQEGNKTVWNITYNDNRLLVNGNDMTRELHANP